MNIRCGHGHFDTSVMGEGGEGGMRASIITLLLMKFGTCIKLDVFYIMITKNVVTSPLLRNYNVITCILADT